MTSDTKTHRCPDCPQKVEHFESELCLACGRCAVHCHETDLCHFEGA